MDDKNIPNTCEETADSPCFSELNKAAAVVSPKRDLNPPVVVGLPSIQALHEEMGDISICIPRWTSASPSSLLESCAHLTFFSSIALSRKSRSLLDSGVSFILPHFSTILFSQIHSKNRHKRALVNIVSTLTRKYTRRFHNKSARNRHILHFCCISATATLILFFYKRLAPKMKMLCVSQDNGEMKNISKILGERLHPSTFL